MPLSSVRFHPREVPLPVVRVASMFATKQEEKPPEIVDEIKMPDGIVDKVNARGFIHAIWQNTRKIPQTTVKKTICVCRRRRMFQWKWPMGSQGVSTMSSSATTTCGWKWETVFTSVHMDLCATAWAGREHTFIFNWPWDTSAFPTIADTGTLYCLMVGKYETQGVWCNGKVMCWDYVCLLIYKCPISNVSNAAFLYWSELRKCGWEMEQATSLVQSSSIQRKQSMSPLRCSTRRKYSLATLRRLARWPAS